MAHSADDGDVSNLPPVPFDAVRASEPLAVLPSADADPSGDPAPWPLPAGFVSPWDPRNLGHLQGEIREHAPHWTRGWLVGAAAACVTASLTLFVLTTVSS